jgi:hypothetical protein
MRLALVIITLTTLTAIGIQSAYAGGPRMDWDERYEDIPGATDCWVDGFDNGLENPIDQERNEECVDKGNQYYRG